MSKSTAWLLATVGSLIGGYLPSLFGAGDFSFWSIISGAVGGLVAIYIGYRYIG